MKGKFLLFCTLVISVMVFSPLADSITSLAKVTVNPIYSLDLEIEVINDRVLAGENLNVSVGLEKTDLSEAGAGKEIVVSLDYEIFRQNKKLTNGSAGMINVTDYKAETIQIRIPSDLKPGRYTLKIIATNPQAYPDSDEDDFWVRKQWRWFSIFYFLDWMMLI